MHADEVSGAGASTREAVLNAYCSLFEQLTIERLHELRPLVSPAIHFRDPFNELHDVDAFIRVFEHMFAHCQAPRFRVLEQQLLGDGAVLRWRFETRVPLLGSIATEGMSHLQFDQQGRISAHLDYWDSAPLYLRLPLLGALLRRLRARMAAV